MGVRGKDFKPGEEKHGLDLLTVNERKFFFAYVKKGTLTAAAKTLRKFPNRSAAYYAGWRYWKQIRAKVDVEALMEAVGLSKVRIFKALDEGLEATFVRPISRSLGGNCGAEIVEMGPYIDHPTRVKAAAESAKIAGLVVEKHVHTGPDGGPIQHALSSLSDEQLRRLAAGSGKCDPE